MGAAGPALAVAHELEVAADRRLFLGKRLARPIVVGLGFWILKPAYMRLLWTDPVGTKFFTYAIVSEIVGILVIRKIANVRV